MCIPEVCADKCPLRASFLGDVVGVLGVFVGIEDVPDHLYEGRASKRQLIDWRGF
jgi:hypothetical protein